MPATIAMLRRRLSGSTDVVRAVLYMALAAFAASAMSGAVRHVSEGMHPFEIAFFRNLFGLIVFLPWLLRYGWAPFQTRQWGLHGLRALTNVVAMLLYFYALSITPLAEVASLGFVVPLFATVFAVIFLRERVRIRRWSALFIGFGGAFIIIRPGFEAVDNGSIMVLVSAALWAISLIVIKVMARRDSAVTIAAIAALLLTPASLIPALFVWQWPSGEQLLWLAAIGAAGTVAQISIAESFRLADSSAVMPLDFTKLIWAALIGYLFFAEVPDIWTWTGGFIIFASATYIAYRENRAAKTRSGVVKDAVSMPPSG